MLHSWGAAAFFPLEELEAGLTGHGLTAGAGNVIERFDVEVLALQEDVGVGFPVVLIRTSGEFIDSAGGVAAGMSGSPVYLSTGGGDALLGAIGFTFPRSDHSLALVTPINVMRGGLRSVTPFNERAFTGLGEPRPVTTPLLLSGVSDRAATHLEELFSSERVAPLPVHVAGANSAMDDAFELEPGSAISVQLVRGDITVSAVGTLTLLEEDRFHAFGHPLLGHGEVSFALAPAYVSHIVQSQVTPFKLADSGKRILGAVREDRPFTVSGRLDVEPDFIPVTLTLNLPRGSVVKRFEIAPGERYYGPLLAAASLQAFDNAMAEISGGTAELAWEISLAGGDTLRLLEQTSDVADVGLSAARLAAEPLIILADNVFADPQVQEIELTMQVEEALRTAEIAEVVPESETPRPGEILVAHVRLQPYRDEPVVKTVEVQLPVDVDGPLEVTFRGGSEREEPVDDGELPILSFAELLVALRDHVQASELVVETVIDGELRRLARLPQPYLIEGSKTLTIDIDGVKTAPPEIEEEEPEEPREEPTDPPFDEPPLDRGPR